MAARTSIEWSDATWNVITGCSRVSRGCGAVDGGGCYAERWAATRLRNHPSRVGLTDEHGRWTGEVRFNSQWLDQPLRWQRPRRIFVCAHGDLFHESVPDAWIDQVFAAMALSPRHVFQVLTKRAARMRSYLHQRGRSSGPIVDAICTKFGPPGARGMAAPPVLPLPNVWLGTSVEDQWTANERIPALLEAPAAVRWISAEPLLGPLDLQDLRPHPGEAQVRYDALRGIHSYGLDCSGCRPRLDWVVAGGESGPRARPMDPDWARSLRDQCQVAGVPFFFKQWGGAAAKAGGRVLDGSTWDQLPAGPGALRPGGSVTSAV